MLQFKYFQVYLKTHVRNWKFFANAQICWDKNLLHFYWKFIFFIFVIWLHYFLISWWSFFACMRNMIVSINMLISSATLWQIKSPFNMLSSACATCFWSKEYAFSVPRKEKICQYNEENHTTPYPNSNKTPVEWGHCRSQRCYLI